MIGHSLKTIENPYPYLITLAGGMRAVAVPSEALYIDFSNCSTNSSSRRTRQTSNSSTGSLELDPTVRLANDFIAPKS